MSPLSEENVLEWMNAVDLYPKFFWKNRENSTLFAGCGQTKKTKATSPPLLWRSFCSKSTDEWTPFSDNQFYPLHSVISSQNPTLPSKRKSIAPFRTKESILSEHLIPTRSQWDQMIVRALKAIDTGQLEKVVCARTVQIKSLRPIEPLSFFHHLDRSNLNAFLIQISPTLAFLGISPERLFRRTDRRIECDALAGTRPREHSQELLESKKDLREFRIVQQDLIEKLNCFCKTPPHAGPIRLAHTATLSHLHSIISGDLKDEVDDQDLLNALHPTPAVGGSPKNQAADFLSKYEPFTRGLYAAPIGYSTPKEADFSVAIRSCLINGNVVSLFAGTGIIKGSDASSEWQESEQKLLNLKRLMYEC